MQKITPHLWFDNEAKEAAAFYTSIFENSRITNSVTLPETPSGSADFVSVELAGQRFDLISAGPEFKFNPSISFLIACRTKVEVESLWGKLSAGGVALMPLAEYPFSERYGWTQDKFGLSWQVMAVGSSEIKQKITPTLMFVGAVCGKAEEAVDFYQGVFHKAAIGDMMRYGKGAEPDREGTIQHMDFTLEGQQFAAMDSALSHPFAFNEAISFMVHCDSQKEIDYYWERLSAVPGAEVCGWLKDKYGLSWQVVPTRMDEMMRAKDSAAVARVTQAVFKMKKLDLATLDRAYAAKA